MGRQLHTTDGVMAKSLRGKGLPYCVRRRKNALLIQVDVNEWILGRISGTPADFEGADDIITNLAKERKFGIEVIERTP